MNKTIQDWANLIEAHIEPRTALRSINGKPLTIHFDNSDWVIQQAMAQAWDEARLAARKADSQPFYPENTSSIGYGDGSGDEAEAKDLAICDLVNPYKGDKGHE